LQHFVLKKVKPEAITNGPDGVDRARSTATAKAKEQSERLT
jgi:hypothetical protein